jgi:RNA polymerase sigma factor (TIGR02999 family)
LWEFDRQREVASKLVIVEAYPEITRLLGEVNAGDPASMTPLMDAVYADLEKMAGARLRDRYGVDMPGVTLEPAALVNETFLRLIKQRSTFDNRGHFFAVATKLMLRVLGDYHRQRQALKRGSGVKVSLGAIPGGDPKTPTAEPSADIPTLVAALEQLETLDARKAEVAKLRLIWGLEMSEVAEVIGASLPTAERDWRFARAWLADACAGTAL